MKIAMFPELSASWWNKGIDEHGGWEGNVYLSLIISHPWICKFRFAGVETHMQNANLDLMLQKSPLSPHLHAFSLNIKFRLFKDKAVFIRVSFPDVFFMLYINFGYWNLYFWLIHSWESRQRTDCAVKPFFLWFKEQQDLLAGAWILEARSKADLLQ